MAVGAGLAAGLPYFVVAAITAVLFGMCVCECMYIMYINVCMYVWIQCLNTYMFVNMNVLAGKFVPSTGAGYGTYTSVDFALLMDVLKNKQDHAKDIAVWHQVCMYLCVCLYVSI